MKKFSKLSPIYGYESKIECVFGDDPDIEIDLEDYNNRIVFTISDPYKFKMLPELLGRTKRFGWKLVYLDYYYSGDQWELEKIEHIKDMFNKAEYISKLWERNPHFDSVKEFQVWGGSFWYVCFKREIVRFYEEDMREGYSQWTDCLIHQLLRDKKFAKKSKLRMRYCLVNEEK